MGVRVVMEIGHKKGGGLEGRIGASKVLDVTHRGWSHDQSSQGLLGPLE